MSSIDLATQFKIGMYLLNRENVTNAFPRSTDIIQVLNELPTDKRHITTRLTGMPYTHQQQEKLAFRKKSFFLLSVLHDQTSVESL